MSPSLRKLRVNGLELAVWEWTGDGPPLLFSHATGFHGRCWDEVIRRLPGRRAIAVELRGHGRSEKPEPPYCWRDFGVDVAEIARQLELRDAVGVGHSMGGHSMAVAAALRPEAFASLLLVDPVIFPPEFYRQPQRRDASYIAKRRNDWTSAEEMFERFRGRPPFSEWHPQVLRDYCEFGVLPEGDRWVLACPPAIEAAIYGASNAPGADPYELLGRIEQPVTVIRAGVPWSLEKFDLGASPCAADLASRFRRGKDVLLEGRSHYIPMETPELVAEALEGGRLG
jgi:pimeloyl-ACP methyl ester carboxylesterase